MKRILAMVICVALLATMAITGSIAYLQDEARDVNTMTMGEVKITQNELKRTDSGYEKFENDEPLYPAVYVGTATSEAPDGIVPDDTEVRIGEDGFWSNVVGAQDKIVSVKNTGKSEAYVRTWFAFEADANGKLDYIHINWTTRPDNVDGTLVEIDEDGAKNKYVVFCVTYPAAIEAGATTENSLLEVHMDPRATNEYVAHFGDTYKILVVSQAVQATNMGESATVALNRAFPAPHPWTTGIYDADLVISTAEDLFNFAKQVNMENNQFIGKTVVLANNIDLAGAAWTPIGTGGDFANFFGGIFDGQNHTISNLYVNLPAGNHAAGLFGGLRGVVKNLTIDGAVIKNTTNISSTTNGTAVVAGSMTYGTDYKNECKIENVTVKNSTVNGNRYVAGICGYANVGSIVNCSVSNTSLTAEFDNFTGSWDNADKVGGILGYSGNAKNVYGNTISGCSVDHVTLTGYRNLGGIVGHGVDENMSNNTATNLTFHQDLSHDYKQDTVTGRFMDEINGAKTDGSISSASAPTVPEDIKIYNAAQLKAFADELNGGNINKYINKTVMLMSDIDLKNVEWTPIGKSGTYPTNLTFDGNNHTIRNLNVTRNEETGASTTGLFGFATGLKVKDLTVDGATVVGSHYCGVILGNANNHTDTNSTIENCRVLNAIVTCTHKNVDDCGDKAGAIVGIADNKTTIKNCSATNCTVKAARDAGQIVGAAFTDKVDNCTAINVTVSSNVVNNECTGANINNSIIGRVLG